MHVYRTNAVRLLRAVGFKEVVKDYDEKKLQHTLATLPSLKEKLQQPESVELSNMLEDVFEARKNGEGIVVHPDEEKDLDTTLEADNEIDLESLATEEEAPEKEAPKQETNGHRTEEKTDVGFRLLSKKDQPVTHALVKAHRELQAFPRDRGVTKARREFLKGEIAAGRYTGSTWDSVKVLTTGETYRVNGTGTSAAAWELLSDGVEVNATVTVRKWEADDMEAAILLYNTFDPQKSARTKANVLQAHAAGDEALLKIKPPTIKLAAAGMGFALHEKDYKKRTAKEQGQLLLKNPDFVEWLSTIVPKKDKDNAHLARMPVVAAMYQTWRKSKKAATEFWTDVRDDVDGVKRTHPKRVLRNWLLTHNFGAKSGTKSVASDREGYVYCLQAWNAWRKDDEEYKPAAKYKPETETPEVA